MHISTHLDPSRLADLARDPNHCKAQQIDAAMLHLNGLLAERAVLNTAGQALDASRRAAFEAMTNNTQAKPSFDRAAGVYPGLCGDLRAEANDLDDDQFTSTQPLGDASVRVVYSSDGKDLSIDGAQVGDQFLHIDFFTAQVRGDWYRAIRAEERLASASDKAAAAASWSGA